MKPTNAETIAVLDPFDGAYEAWLLLGLDPEEALWAAAVWPEAVLVQPDPPV